MSPQLLKNHNYLKDIKNRLLATHLRHSEEEVYFITFTCHQWLPLIHKANAYHAFYGFFNYLRKQNVPLLGYVIMPNHFHGMLFVDQLNSLNKLVSNGKRFLAYEIVRKLKEKEEFSLLNILEEGVAPHERLKNKKHQVFRLSFDAKICASVKACESALDYIHHNPVNGKWNLADDFTNYAWSSAAYYEKNDENPFVTHYKEILG